MTYRQDAIDTRATFAESGGQAVVAWETRGEYVPGEPEPVAVVHSYTAPGAVVAYASREIGTQADSLIKAGDRNLLLAAVDEQGEPLTPPPFGAAVTLADGSLYKVANCKLLQPDGLTIVMFDITIRS